MQQVLDVHELSSQYVPLQRSSRPQAPMQLAILPPVAGPGAEGCPGSAPLNLKQPWPLPCWESCQSRPSQSWAFLAESSDAEGWSCYAVSLSCYAASQVHLQATDIAGSIASGSYTELVLPEDGVQHNLACLLSHECSVQMQYAICNLKL